MHVDRKFKLTDEIKIEEGNTLYRIEALRSFADVNMGDKGGCFIGTVEEFLSASEHRHQGNTHGVFYRTLIPILNEHMTSSNSNEAQHA